MSFENRLERLSWSSTECFQAELIHLSTIVYTLSSHLCRCFDFVTVNTELLSYLMN